VYDFKPILSIGIPTTQISIIPIVNIVQIICALLIYLCKTLSIFVDVDVW